MVAHFFDHPKMSALQPGDFYELREDGVVGFAFAFESQQGRDVAGLDLRGPVPFSVRQLGAAICRRSATRGTAKLQTSPKDYAAQSRIKLGTVLEDVNGRHYLAVALPESASFPPGTEAPTLVFVSLDEWSLQFVAPQFVRTFDRWAFTCGAAVLFDRTA